MTEALFSYGTLQQDKVQLETFGRKLNGHKDALAGFKMVTIEITDPKVLATSGLKFHNIISRSDDTNDSVDGMVLTITHDELLQADAYEVDDYTRVSVVLKSGTKAWVYVAKAAL